MQTKRETERPARPTDSMLPSQVMERILAVLRDREMPDRSARCDEAHEIMGEAHRAGTRCSRAAFARKTLQSSSNRAAAYLLLAEDGTRSVDESIGLYRKGIEAGKHALGAVAFAQGTGHLWEIPEARTYLRAMQGLASCLWQADMREEAVERSRELLRLNPHDNQGIHSILMPWLIELELDKQAEALFYQYKHDVFAGWAYSRALLDFRRDGETGATARALERALRINRYVPAYLVEEKKLPHRIPRHCGFGDGNEAILYAWESKAAWQGSSGALAWLAVRTQFSIGSLLPRDLI